MNIVIGILWAASIVGAAWLGYWWGNGGKKALIAQGEQKLEDLKKSYETELAEWKKKAQDAIGKV